MIYRKSAVWGEGGSSGTLVDRVMNTLFYNGCMHLILRAGIDRKEITDLYYLNLVPWFKINNRDIEWFRREGERTVIGLEGNSRIEQDWAAKTYSVVVDGAEIARDMATFCQLGGNRVVFYAQTERRLSAAMPNNWKAEEIAAVALTSEEAHDFAVRVEHGRIYVDAPSRQPVIVYANRGIIPQN